MQETNTSDNTETRVCRKCGEARPLVKFLKSKGCVGGRGRTCRYCSVDPEKIRAKDRERYRRDKEKRLAANKRYRELNLDYFRQYGRVYYKQHREEILAQTRKYYEENKDRHAAYQKKWKAENRGRYQERTRQWYEQNKDKIQTKNKEWRRNNRQILREQGKIARARRRAKQLGAPGLISVNEWMALLEAADYCCACCGRKGETQTMDHIIPLSSGGSIDIDNVQPLCLNCNCEKALKIIDYRPRTIRERFGRLVWQRDRQETAVRQES